MEMDFEYQDPVRITAFQYHEAITKLPPVPKYNEPRYGHMNRYKIAVIDFEEERRTQNAWENEEDFLAQSVPVIELEFEIVRSGMQFFWQCTRPVLLIPDSSGYR